MLNHTVIFWLKKELSPQDKEMFHQELEKLGMIESVHQLHIGSPAATTQRPVIDHSYDFCLTPKSGLKHIGIDHTGIESNGGKTFR